MRRVMHSFGMFTGGESPQGAMYSFGMFVGGDSPLDAVTRSRALKIAVLAAAMLLCVSVAVPFAFAQDPEDVTPEPGYLDAPGDIGYGEPRIEPPDGVSGQNAHGCDYDPRHETCPPRKPTNLQLTVSTDDLSLSYTRQTWYATNEHWYRVELHQSATSGGTYDVEKTIWDNASPAPFPDVDRGFYYKARAKRCLTRSDTSRNCGFWTDFTSVVYVPNLPGPATGLSQELSEGELRATYSSTGASSDQIDIDRRLIGTTRPVFDYRVVNRGSGYSWSGIGGYEYRFRVKRCLDSARTT